MRRTDNAKLPLGQSVEDVKLSENADGYDWSGKSKIIMNQEEQDEDEYEGDQAVCAQFSEQDDYDQDSVKQQSVIEAQKSQNDDLKTQSPKTPKPQIICYNIF